MLDRAVLMMRWANPLDASDWDCNCHSDSTTASRKPMNTTKCPQTKSNHRKKQQQQIENWEMTISLEVCMNMCELWIANSHVPQTSNIYPKKHLAIFQIIYNNESPNQKKWIATKTLHGLCSLRHIVEIFHILHNCGPIAQEIFSMLCVSIVCTRSRNLPCASGFVWIRVCGCVCVWAMHGITTKCAIFLRKKPSYKWLLCEWNISTLAINNTPFTHFPTWKNISSCSIFIKASMKKKNKSLTFKWLQI